MRQFGIAKLVHITSISLWFMVDISISISIYIYILVGFLSREIEASVAMDVRIVGDGDGNGLCDDDPNRRQGWA